MNDILLLILSAIVVFIGYRVCRNRPDLFTAEAITSAIGTFGVLAIFLILVVGFGVLMLRSL
ncbi:MAG: hypothetical protein VXW87_01035 [Pseudomonadota bacterium]|nr:hypothetical protein [Pseudomonadota bacterium]